MRVRILLTGAVSLSLALNIVSISKRPAMIHPVILLLVLYVSSSQKLWHCTKNQFHFFSSSLYQAKPGNSCRFAEAFHTKIQNRAFLQFRRCVQRQRL
jgi:hypothetical protein